MWLYIVGDIKTSVMHCLNVSRDTRHFNKNVSGKCERMWQIGGGYTHYYPKGTVKVDEHFLAKKCFVKTKKCFYLKKYMKIVDFLQDTYLFRLQTDVLRFSH